MVKYTPHNYVTFFLDLCVFVQLWSDDKLVDVSNLMSLANQFQFMYSPCLANKVLIVWNLRRMRTDIIWYNLLDLCLLLFPVLVHNDGPILLPLFPRHRSIIVTCLWAQFFFSVVEDYISSLSDIHTPVSKFSSNKHIFHLSFEILLSRFFVCFDMVNSFAPANFPQLFICTWIPKLHISFCF